MIDNSRFVKRWTVDSKEFGLLKRPWKISENNIRKSETATALKDIELNLVPNIKEIGLQQIPVVNGKGEVFIGGRRAVAVEMLGEETLLVEIRDIPAEEQLIASWSENYVKKDMRADEEGEGFKRIKDLTGWSNVKLAKRLGVHEATIRRKIGVYDEFKIRRGAEVPHDTAHDNPRNFNFGKAIELLPDWISEENKTKMYNEITQKGLTRDQVRKVTNTSRTMLHVVEECNEEFQKEILDAINPMLFTKEVNAMEVLHKINDITHFSQKTIAHQIPKERYSSQKEADDEYFIPRGGRCLGSKTEEYWYGTIDPVKAKKLKKLEKK